MAFKKCNCGTDMLAAQKGISAGWPQYAESYPLTYTGVVSLDTTQCYSFSLLTCTWTIGVPYEGASFVMPEGSHGLGVPLRLLVHDAFDTDASSKPSGSEVYFYDVDSTLWKVAIEAVWTNAPTTFDSEMRVWVPTLYE